MFPDFIIFTDRTGRPELINRAHVATAFTYLGISGEVQLRINTSNGISFDFAMSNQAHADEVLNLIYQGNTS